MIGLFLIARIADERVALPTVAVGSVVEVDQVAPVPRVAPHIAGLFALRSRVLTVIDSRAALGLGRIVCTGIGTAVIVESDGHSYALLVDEVEDVVEALPPAACPSVLEPGWRRVALGTIRHEGQALLLVDPIALIAGEERSAA
ncbi:chemotaxis protein CheW [Sphingomonas nostoxanthinifaciens]|uniref:chemotaxis protein CheW n=1 Tax=Sphingomonas nostoxanthinifaciens TaxID=2872652 RepID=UPI001CC1E655|nr:chemotaxis protein CheW [Sphingomonas nostoxanthinifaciens]UAK26318.1 chemotaxis protein CheW [Sphingomonas nostoxanthinifaciens]